MSASHYAYFDHDADIGVTGYGDTLEESFVQAARAVFAYMVNLAAVQPKQVIQIQFAETDSEFALVEWLNSLLAAARQNNLIFCQFKLRREQDQWLGEAAGEPWRDSLERGTEVKGATLTELSVKQTQAGWESRCIIDV